MIDSAKGLIFENIFSKLVIYFENIWQSWHKAPQSEKLSILLICLKSYGLAKKIYISSFFMYLDGVGPVDKRPSNN